MLGSRNKRDGTVSLTLTVQELNALVDHLKTAPSSKAQTLAKSLHRIAYPPPMTVQEMDEFLAET